MAALVFALVASLAPSPHACEAHAVPGGTVVVTCGGRVAARLGPSGDVRVYYADGRIGAYVGGRWEVL